jgi:replication factor C subunit 3/5
MINNKNNKNNIPWVEKYRPENFDDIVLDNYNKEIFENMLKNNYIPNLLLYGPPGSGKTTTIINLINKYQENNNEVNKSLIIHLNASDERGIDIIRNQINNFVNSNCLFIKGLRFVILDEVDYMTKNAQQALKYLLEDNKNSIRFCLICNYISKIDYALQSLFIRIKFNELPKKDIICMLNNIKNNERLDCNISTFENLYNYYKSDVRSMINHLQSKKNDKILNNKNYENITKYAKTNDLSNFIKYLNGISNNYNIDKKNIIKNYSSYVIFDFKDNIIEYIDKFKFIIHNLDININYIISYLYLIINKYL